MKNLVCLLVFSVSLFWLGLPASGQESWSPDQQGVLTAIEQLSAATAPDGAGPEAYGAVLHDGFKRWTLGTDEFHDKESWIAGMRDWFDEGWRVLDRKTTMLKIDVQDDVAFTRRVVEETYAGPDGESSRSRAALAEVWVRGDDGWLLFRVDMRTLDTDS